MHSVEWLAKTTPGCMRNQCKCHLHKHCAAQVLGPEHLAVAQIPSDYDTEDARYMLQLCACVCNSLSLSCYDIFIIYLDKRVASHHARPIQN